MVLAETALAGKVAVLTGGERVLAQESAYRWPKRVPHVIISPHSNVAGAEQCAQRFRQIGREPLVVACDVCEESQVMALFDAAIERFGRVDALVNNAGITEPRPLLERTRRRACALPSNSFRRVDA